MLINRKHALGKSLAGLALAWPCSGLFAGTFEFARESAPVPLLSPLHKEVLATETSALHEKLKVLDFQEKIHALKTVPLKARFAWTYRPDAAAGEKMPKEFLVTLVRRSDGAVVERIPVKKGEAEFCNLEIACAYSLHVAVMGGERNRDELFAADHAFVTEDTPPRLLYVEDVGNVRDVGGWIGEGGQRTRQGLVFRSQAFNHNAAYCDVQKDGKKVDKPRDQWKEGRIRGTELSRRQCRIDLGIKTELDFRRAENECWRMTGSPLGRSVDWQPIPSAAYAALDNPECRRQFARDFRFLTDEDNYPVDFHCIGGADRTGSFAYILNALLGVKESDLDADYHLTAFNMRGPWPLLSDKPDAICRLAGLKKVFAKYEGGTENERVRRYVLDCGITEEEIRKFKDIMFGRLPVPKAGRNAWQTFNGAGTRVRRQLMRNPEFRKRMCETGWTSQGVGVGVPRCYPYAKNLRDLGGWKTDDGGVLRFGRLFRSGSFDKAEERRALRKKLGIRTDLDLRKPEQCLHDDILKLVNVVAGNYGGSMNAKGGRWLKGAFDALLDESNYPIVFHCAQGADRTGTLAFVIEILCGVDEDDAYRDWQLTAFCNSNLRFEDNRYDRMVAALFEQPGDTWKAKVESLLKSVGVGDGDIVRFREMMVEHPERELKR